jgi:hypothetical protein
MKASDRIGKRVRVLFDRSGDPRMGELQQQSATGAKKDRGLSIDMPVNEPGPNTPACAPVAAARIRLSSRSRSSALTSSCSMTAVLLMWTKTPEPPAACAAFADFDRPCRTYRA